MIIIFKTFLRFRLLRYVFQSSLKAHHKEIEKTLYLFCFDPLHLLISTDASHKSSNGVLWEDDTGHIQI